MKKIVFNLLIVLNIIGLIGCGAKEPYMPTEEEKKVLGMSYVDMGYNEKIIYNELIEKYNSMKPNERVNIQDGVDRLCDESNKTSQIISEMTEKDKDISQADPIEPNYKEIFDNKFGEKYIFIDEAIVESLDNECTLSENPSMLINNKIGDDNCPYMLSYNGKAPMKDRYDKEIKEGDKIKIIKAKTGFLKMASLPRIEGYQYYIEIVE